MFIKLRRTRVVNESGHIETQKYTLLLNIYTLGMHYIQESKIKKFIADGYKIIDINYNGKKFEYLEDIEGMNKGSYIVLMKDNNCLVCIDRDGRYVRKTKEEIENDLDLYVAGVINLYEKQYLFKDANSVSIAREYKKFVAKSKALGMSNEFEYVVLNGEVIITNYIGKSRHFTVPKFVTGISWYALGLHYNAKIDTLKLNKELKYFDSDIEGNSIIKLVNNVSENYDVVKKVW